MEKQTGEQLLKKLKDGSITPEELQMLESWYENYISKAAPFDDALVYLKDMEILDQAFPFERENQRGKTKTNKLWPRLGIAAAIVLIIGSLALMLNLFKSPNLGVSMSSTYENNIAPGREGATLTLANGQKIKLSDALSGELAEEAGVVITKSADGQIVYEMKDKGNNINSTNTLSTSKGETYQVRLPDGSLVSLNAASSLTYATSLNERGERRVRLSGEAFFEISKDKKHPFIVESRGQEVKVLGTQFNINAYDDEVSIKTTLLEGSVMVLGEKDVMLKPGEQARNLGNSIAVSKVDTELATAWKNNQFIFESQDIQAIMRMISRWYNVEVVYQGEVPIHKFSGSISRFEYVSEVLQSLESTAEVRFQIEGRRIIVRK